MQSKEDDSQCLRYEYVYSRAQKHSDCLQFFQEKEVSRCMVLLIIILGIKIKFY